MNTDKTKTPEQNPRKREGERREICRECGLDWNVSKKAVIPLNGYLCPRCYGKYKNK